MPENDAEVIADLMKQYPVLLDKSNVHVPSKKVKMKEALQVVCGSLTQTLGRPFDCEKLKKRLSNMRARGKAKSYRNLTGNRPIKLLKWEKMFSELLQAEENPFLS